VEPSAAQRPTADAPSAVAPLARAHPARRPATDAEARALASSLRLQILRMTLDEPLTNQELAVRLGRNPASVLHHVRTLVDAGFLVALAPRRGVRGSREIPYRATGTSWYLDDSDPQAGAATARALVEAFVTESGTSRLAGAKVFRLGLRLTDAEVDELEHRLHAVLQDYAVRTPSPEGRPWSLFLALHHDPNRD